MKRFAFGVVFGLVCCMSGGCAEFWASSPHIMRMLADYSERYQRQDCETAQVKIVIVRADEPDKPETICVPNLVGHKED